MRFAATLALFGSLTASAAGTAASVPAIGLNSEIHAVSASFVQFHGAFGVAPITGSPLGRAILAAAIALVAGIAWTLRSLRAYSRV